jgi:excisionase family DNA binding protein
MKDGQRETGEKMEPLLVRVEEAARILGLGRSTVYELMDRGELRFVKYGAAACVGRAAYTACGR